MMNKYLKLILSLSLAKFWQKRFPSTVRFERLILKNRYENGILDTNGLRERGKCNGAKRTIVYDR